jgi:hypothetical protein
MTRRATVVIVSAFAVIAIVTTAMVSLMLMQHHTHGRPTASTQWTHRTSFIRLLETPFEFVNGEPFTVYANEPFMVYVEIKGPSRDGGCVTVYGVNWGSAPARATGRISLCDTNSPGYPYQAKIPITPTAVPATLYIRIFDTDETTPLQTLALTIYTSKRSAKGQDSEPGRPGGPYSPVPSDRGLLFCTKP